MKIYLIVARSRNHVIGSGSRIPWRVKGEQKLFREITTGNTLVMGRKTYESIGQPLPDRDTVIVTRQGDYAAPGCTVVNGLEEAIEAAGELRGDCFIAGGGEIYRQALAIADGVHLTAIDLTVEGDVTFPELSGDQFELVESREYHSNAAYTYQFWRRR